MGPGTAIQPATENTFTGFGGRLGLLRMMYAAQPITRTELARRLGVDKSTITEHAKPLIDSGILKEELAESQGVGRRNKMLSFAPSTDYFIGVNLGVRRSQVGAATLDGSVLGEDEFPTPADARTAIRKAAESIKRLRDANGEREAKVIGVSVPGITDTERSKLLYAPNLAWRDVSIAEEFGAHGVRVVIENDCTAAAMYEARIKLRETDDGLRKSFVLVRSGTGIGVGLVVGGEVFRGSGLGRGFAGEFGHMTIVAGGKPCVCGNRGCWEKYASAASAASLYLGDRPPQRGEEPPRFVEIVSKADNGEVRSKRTLEKIGDYLGIGIANVIMGTGIPRVVISGRLVYGWKYIVGPVHEAVRRSIIGGIDGWSIEAGSPAGAAIGGALEAAADEYLRMI